ncbi:Cell surface protein [Methanosarcina horonobensis HB-1 = JCM 15518]|uniref:Cell surface protein n=1 Tax=Methanosarcina horonobensis HB-1 = JCM 15518 TaxID=1434110 RepID=A0A0E3SAP1_9EURY|nr:NosD domain-containing protein [Methanosarcina horonobensis]AKB77891.1 Cell surface protein [Methanosarcina horonobensis HB-1 = JCM 15518]
MYNASPGDTIIVGPGTYTENLNINKSLIIRSSGSSADTIIVANNTNAHVITIQDQNSVTMKGFNITGAGTNYSGIYVLRSPNCVIEDNILHNDGLGVYLKTSNNNIIRNNTASKNLLIGTGTGFNIEQSNYTTVSNNTVSNHGYGIYVRGSQGEILSGNTISQNAIDSIVVENSISNILENNTVKSNARYGVYLSGSGNNSLRYNLVSNGTNGIYLVGSPENTISGNTVDFGSSHDIMLDNSSDNSVTNNTISSSEYGIAVRYSNNNILTGNNAYNNTQGLYITLTSSNNTLSGNTANSNSGTGISLYRVSDNILESNEANSNANQGILLDNSSNNEVFNNSISQNSRGIYLSSSSSGNEVSGNIVNSNTGRGIELYFAGSNNLTSNVVSSNSNYGIYLTNSSNSFLISNTASSNSKGIYVVNSSECMISNNTVSNNRVDLNNSNGIMLSNSSNNTLYMNKAVNNPYGISLDSSQNNNISSNNVTLSTKHGLFLCARSTNNLIFNNYLNNTFNTNNNNTQGIWNITITPGRSIVNGPNTGGNYWANPLGTGFSQTATDADGDGIADSVYNGDNLVDYHPLVAVNLALPVANFSSNVTSGLAPLSVQFTDSSQNATGWKWDFDNNGVVDSIIQNPVNVYTVPGNYTVNLTVNNENGTNSKFGNITVSAGSVLPVANFTTNITSGNTPLTVLFTDTSQNATGWNWNFGDGATSTEQNPTHTYFATGTYTVNLTVSNGNSFASKIATITVLESNSDDDNDDSSGGSSHSSGGGGGGGSPEPARNVEVKELSQVVITNGKAAQFDFTKNATCVVYVGFDAKKTVGKTTTIVEQLKNKSTLVSNLSEGEVYRYFNVWVGNSGFASSENIENPNICFKVEKSWIKDKNIDKDSITLNRYSNKTWEQLPVSLSGEDDKYLYFKSSVPGYSFFAITGKSNASSEETVTEIQPEGKPDNSEENIEDTGSEVDHESDGDEESTGMPGFDMVYGIAGLLAVFLYKRK